MLKFEKTNEGFIAFLCFCSQLKGNKEELGDKRKERKTERNKN